MPAAHKEFLASLPWCVEHPDYLFVHAGLDPAGQIATLRQRDFPAFQPKWLYSERVAFCGPSPDTNQGIVSDHTIGDGPIVTGCRISVDADCGDGGSLTALWLPGRLVIPVPP
jgi:hypothetical protein